MIALAGYENFMQIHDSADSQVYRARRVRDNQPVIIKFLNRDYPTPEQIRRYKQEYQLTCQLKLPGVIRAYSLEQWQRTYGIAFEDFGGISLKRWLQKRKKLQLSEFLSLAIAITESLGQIHSQNIIHKDINPANIVFNPSTQQLKIIDFGIATQLTRENPTVKNPHVLEGTLAYISPEQTGRMNRGLDYRTDFYSLGVTFYEMLTGQLPFESNDPLELVHCHIAKMPGELGNRQQATGNSRGREAPQIVADIVMKLMAKNAEDRYQSAYGLKADLEKCHRQLEEIGEVVLFPLGQQDICDRFQTPQKLYGREREITQLLKSFEQVAETGKTEIILVKGYSGMGKSSLVGELYKPITACRGYFLSGKFDQFQRNVPYSGLVGAFRGLIQQLLGDTQTQLQVWREKLLQALGKNGQIIIDVIPEVELIIGKQPAVPLVGNRERNNRFNLVFSNFIGTFCDPNYPLTIVLDDLQWADSATLNLMERLLTEGKIRYLLMLGAYRDNEVSASHPLAATLDRLQQNNHRINEITLKSLPLDQVANLISDTLQYSPTHVRNLAQLVWHKTGGNPFFVNEFLQALSGEKLLQFHHSSRTWQWNMAAIKARDFTNNVVELMVAKLQKLSPSVQEVLSLAACWGAEFDLQLMTWLLKKSPQEVFNLLTMPLKRGLITPLSEPDENLLIQFYKFGHDRIQQAAYTLIPEVQRPQKHLAIGRVLLENHSEIEQEDKLFDIVDQLNRSIDLIENGGEQENLAILNLQAGIKASDANAYGAAMAYFDQGISLLEENSWQHQYNLTLTLYQEATKAAYLNADLEQMEALAEIIAREAKNPVDRLELAKTKIDAYTNQRRFTEALNAGLESLAALGIEFPQAACQKDFAPGHINLPKISSPFLQKILVFLIKNLPTNYLSTPHLFPLIVLGQLANIKNLIGDRQPADLANLPKMQDPLIREALTLLVKISPVTYMAAPALFPLVVFKQIELSINYGNAPVSAFSYATYGMFLCGTLEEFSLGYEYGQLALKVLSQSKDKQFEAAILMPIHHFINHWTTHLQDSIEPLQQAFWVGLETGDLSYGGYAIQGYCLRLYLTGRNLGEIEQEIESYHDMLEAVGQKTALGHNLVFWQAVLNLQGKSEQPHRLIGKVMDEVSLIADYEKIPNELGLWGLYVPKATLCYLFEEFDEALAATTSAQEYSAAAMTHPLTHVWCFYDSLARLAKMRQLGTKSEKITAIHTLNEVVANQEKLKRWAEFAPMNCLHKFYLVEAEYYRVMGDKVKAIEFYSLAIAKAKEHQYLQEEALANELAAKFYLHWGQEKTARVYMMDARYCYNRWGAIAKVKHLEENYPQLCQAITATTQVPSQNWKNNRETKDFTNMGVLDLATVIKSTSAISSEIVLEKLLANLMDILVENAGAQRGILLLPRGDSLFIEAIKEDYLEGVSVLQSLPLQEFAKLSSQIVNYVCRTQTTIVLQNANHQGQFTDDSYIQQHQCKSIACTPLINQGQLQGIIYLENNLATGVFTQERMVLLRTLATQAAIALENARLYDACRRFVPEQFLSFLDKKSLVDVELGNQVERQMTVLFSDIRDFTTISEQMTPAENFAFINEYLGYMEPQIKAHGGFIDKYIGDAIMALFPNSVDDAVKGAIAILKELQTYNRIRQERNLKTLRIGIGLHTGTLILGTVGGLNRMDGTAIGDAVNLSSRVEGLTKTYGVSFLITHKTLAYLNNPLEYDLRFIEKVKAKGKAKAVGLFEIFSADSPKLKKAKIATKEKFEKAVMLYHSEFFKKAAYLFQECIDYDEGDRTAHSYLERCHHHMTLNK